MSKIVIKPGGPEGIAWIVWHAAWLFGLFWVPWFNPEWAPWYFRMLYTVFLPIEAIGVWRNRLDADENVARTMSEFRQFIAQVGKGPDGVGWKGLAAVTAIVDAVNVWYITKDYAPWAGAVLGTGVWLWLAPHFGWRTKVGVAVLLAAGMGTGAFV